VSEYPLVKLSELAEISGGITKNSKRSTLPIQRPYLAVANVYANRLDLEKVGTIGVSEGELGRAELKDGDLLVVEGNGSLSQLGRVALWRGEIKGCLHQNHLIKVRPGEEVESKWILYWLMSPTGRQAIEAIGSSTSGLHTLSLSKVSSLPAPLAPKEVQYRAIAYIELHLSRLDETIATLKAIQAKLKQARASILKAAVEGRLVESGNENEPSTPQEGLSYGQCIPSHWQMRSIRDLFDQRLGKMLDKANNSGDLTPYLRNANVRWQSFDLDDLKLMRISAKETQETSIKHGDIVVCEGGEPGRCAVWKSHQNVVIQKALHRLRAREPLNPSFFAYQLEDAVSRGKIEQFYTGSTIKHLTGAKLKQIILASPPLEEQDLIVDEVERRFSVLDQVEATVSASLRRCGQLRQALLKRAFEE
jgi:type I restriction enzyme S subunit